jgi:hypothetical protein
MAAESTTQTPQGLSPLRIGTIAPQPDAGPLRRGGRWILARRFDGLTVRRGRLSLGRRNRRFLFDLRLVVASNCSKGGGEAQGQAEEKESRHDRRFLKVIARSQPQTICSVIPRRRDSHGRQTRGIRDPKTWRDNAPHRAHRFLMGRTHFCEC